MNKIATDPLLEFRRVNVDGTLNLAHQDCKVRVCRIVFMSSIKVNGGCVDLGHPFTADQISMPSDSCGILKYEAKIGS